MLNKNTKLSLVLELAKECKCCGKCCLQGSGILAEGDVQKIAKHLKMSELELNETFLEDVEMFNKIMQRPKFKKPYGKCVFLDDDNKCKINEVKPLQCKVGNPCSSLGEELNEWFLLNHCVDVNNAESVREWNVRLNYKKTIPGGELKDLVPNTKRLKKIMEYEEL